MKTLTQAFQALPTFSTLVALLWLAHLPMRAAQSGDFTYTNTGSAITITRYTGYGGAVTIPGTITGLPVTRIGYAAFRNYSDLLSVAMPGPLVSIEGSAFQNCYNLTSAPIPSLVTNIGAGAFWNCYNLANLTIPNSVLCLGDEAFLNCRQIPNIAIPNSVTHVGSAAFAGCSRAATATIGTGVRSIGYAPFTSCPIISAISVDPLNPFLCSRDGVLFDKPVRRLIQCPGGKAGGYTIPDTVTEIATNAFEGCGRLTNVTMPEGLLRLEHGAFRGCALAGITIARSVTNIGAWAFSSCERLSQIAIGNRVAAIEDYAFLSCTNLTSIILPDSVRWFGDAVFYNCTSLMEVCFRGNAPNIGLHQLTNLFLFAHNVTVYYLPGTSGWGETFGLRPTAAWWIPVPTILDSAPGFGIQTNRFGFRISWATNASVVVDASATLGTADWKPIATNTIAVGINPHTDGWSDFIDPDPATAPARFYRLRSP